MNLLNRLVHNTTFTGYCWLWDGAVDRDGYGIVTIRGRARRVARVSYIMFYREQPDQVDHLCEEKACWNPDHLENTDSLTNLRRSRGWYQIEGVWFCPEGHKMTEMNTYARPDGVGRCRTCRMLYMRQYRRRA